jgi:hypothetical protein
MNDDGVLSRKAKPAWGVMVLIGSILVAAAGALGAARAVAKVEAQQVVAPVERKIDDHLAAVVPTKELMEAFVDEQRQFNRDARRQLEALCRASPHANCPLSGGR